MEEPARHLLFHAVIILLIGLLTGIPYGKAILTKANDRQIDAWRVAHAALPIGAILLLVLSTSLTNINVALNLKWAITILFITSGYAFAWALILGPILGFRGLSSKGPVAAKLVYGGNTLGAMTSLLGTLVLLYAAWLNL